VPMPCTASITGVPRRVVSAITGSRETSPITTQDPIPAVAVVADLRARQRWWVEQVEEFWGKRDLDVDRCR
jgi:hypothetical protein